MVTATVTAPVRTVSGYEDISIQLVEQSPLAGGLDRMIFTDLLASYNYRLNAAVINGSGTAGDLTGLLVTAGIGTVTYTAGTPTAQGIITAIAQGLSTVAKNRYMGAEAITMHPSIWYMLVGSTDSSNRPLVVPSVAGPTNAGGVIDVPGQAQGLVGTVHGVAVYLDAAIPTTLSSTQSAIIVSTFSDTFLMESGAKTRVLPDVGSANLTVRFQLYGYAAIAARYPAGIAKIVGSGLVPQTGY
jgi:HK97 family phage major capsid protein